jgi:peptide chain release factor 1
MRPRSADTSAVDQRRRIDDARLFHLEPEVVALTRPLTHPAEDGLSAVLLRDVVDEFHDDDGLSDPGPAEQPRLAALHVRRDQVNDLDPRLEDLGLGLELLEGRRVPVDRPPLLRVDRSALVHRLAQHIEDPAERRVPHRDGDRLPGIDDIHAPGHAVRRVHGDRADLVAADVLCDFADQAMVSIVIRPRELERVIDLGQPVRCEFGIDDRSDHLNDFPDVSVRLRHVCPRWLLCLPPRSDRSARTAPTIRRARRLRR